MRGLMRITRLAVVLAMLAVPALPARAGSSVTIRALDDPFRFNPDTVVGLTTSPDDPAMDHPIFWRNDGDVDHQVRENQDQEGIALRTGVLSPGETSGAHRLRFAATWKYICLIHGEDMDGTIRVRPALYEAGDPGDYPVTNGPNGEAILRLANDTIPELYLFDVQRRRGDGDWVLIREHIHRRTIVLSPNADGVYRFRVRIFHNSSGSHTAWSPVSRRLTIT